MGHYGSGLTLGRSCMLDKERIKHALDGEIMIDDTEDGFVYGPGTPEECKEFIISAYDNAVYWALDGLDRGRGMEALLASKGIHLGKDYTLQEYMEYMQHAKREFAGAYEYESDIVVEDYIGG